jgi:rod shape-determining protein MreC
MIVEQSANDRLQRLAAKLAVENSRLREARLENIRLRLLLEFEQESLFGLYPAKVIGWDADRTVNSILINMGEGDGVREGMPVLTPDGLVGKVYQVMPAMSIVQLLLDRNCRVSAIVQRTRALGIVEWERGYQCFLRKIPARSDVKEGDVVVTSGMGGVFPRGLVIGTVSSVGGEKWELFKNIVVKPGVDFTNVEEVFVLIHEESTQFTAGDSSAIDPNDTR